MKPRDVGGRVRHELWTEAPPALAIGAGQTHVWRVPVQAWRARLDALAETLEDDERERARRFVFPRDRERFLVSRGTRRLILARYLGGPAGTLRFEQGEHGKPHLAPGMTQMDLRFNASDSGEWVLVALTLARDVGVDVERVDAARADAGVAGRFFSGAENEALSRLRDDDWTRGFFDCWARKEAFIKAIGRGLSFPLDAFSVSLGPHVPARLLSLRGCGDDVSRWEMVALSVAPGYSSALVVSGEIGELSQWTLVQ